jgi:DNA-binding transcriptional LysR family regulator
VAPSVVLEATTIESACSAVAARLGVAFVGEQMARIFAMPGVVCRPFAPPAPLSRLGVAWRHDTASNTVRWFLEVLDELVGASRSLAGWSRRWPLAAGRRPGWPGDRAPAPVS